jgi:diguanylate cyclase (GGDEF)-like protein
MFSIGNESRPRDSIGVRRMRYAGAGAAVAAAVPVGVLGAKVAGRWWHTRPGSLRDAFSAATPDRAGLLYASLSSILAVAFFGFVLGRRADQLATLSRTDDLTGLWNARGLLAHLDAELARSRRYREPLTLVLIDIDGLKNLNDRDGHRAGNDAIRVVAAAIRAAMRKTDIGARWGGDEFAIVAPSASGAAALILAERVRELIERQCRPTALTGSVGAATIEPDDNRGQVDAAALMRAADAALYAAKRGGRNRVVHVGVGARQEH